MSRYSIIRAAEELTLLRTVAGAFGITLQAVVQFRRTPLHQLDLSDHLGGRRFASFDPLSQLSLKLHESGLTEAVAQSQLGRLIRQEAALLAMNDAFLLGACVFVGLAVFVWFAKPTTLAPTLRAETLRQAEAEEFAEQP